MSCACEVGGFQGSAQRARTKAPRGIHLTVDAECRDGPRARDHGVLHAFHELLPECSVNLQKHYLRGVHDGVCFDVLIGGPIPDVGVLIRSPADARGRLGASLSNHHVLYVSQATAEGRL